MLSFLLSFLTFSNLNNSLFIQNHNSLNLSYTLAENQFVDVDYVNEYNPSFHSLLPNQQINDAIVFDNDITPLQKDWRDEYKVSSVKNQEHCGGCWAFSSSGAVESIWAIQKNMLYNLSQQELIDCSTDLGNKGCEGGSMDLGFQYIIHNGLCRNASYPYVASDQECIKDQCSSVVNISNYGNLKPNDEINLRKGVFQQPVSVAIQANKRSFQLYQSGIYNDYDCGTELDHGVLVVGYGYDFESDMKYWIIKNSWGSNWGENGYIRILKDIDDEHGLCGVAMQPSIPIL